MRFAKSCNDIRRNSLSRTTKFAERLLPLYLKLLARLAFGLSLIPALNSLAAAQTDSVTHAIETLDVNGIKRSFALERFHVNQAGGTLPIIIYLHGIGGDITQPEGPSFSLPFDTLANFPPALIVRPQGVDGKWNAPAADAASHRAWLKRLLGLEHAPADDVAFLRMLVDTLAEQDKGDPRRVYVVGVSAGGYMAARVACELNDTVTAVAILAATARSSTLLHCKSGRPVPVLLMVSTTDPHAPYAGSDGYASGPETAWFFKNRNGCKTSTETPIAHVNQSVDATISLLAFTQCRDDADVLFYREDGAGHNLPSKAPVDPKDAAIVGPRNADIDATEVVWDFFRNETLARP
jgi:polyhydroxybutyrate depolymerase